MGNVHIYYKVSWVEFVSGPSYSYWESKEKKVYNLDEARELKEEKETLTGMDAEIYKITETTERIK